MVESHQLEHEREPNSMMQYQSHDAWKRSGSQQCKNSRSIATRFEFGIRVETNHLMTLNK